MGRKAKDLTNIRFGKLVAIRRNVSYLQPKRRCRETMWLCLCDCGNEVTTRSSRLLSQQSRSCGCLKKDLAATFGPRLSQFKKKAGVSARAVYVRYQGKCIRRNIVFNISFDEFMTLAGLPCYYCGRVKVNTQVVPSGEIFKYNGMDRIEPSEGYVLDNVVSCCGWCNTAKFEVSAEEFIENCKRVVEHQLVLV